MVSEDDCEVTDLQESSPRSGPSGPPVVKGD